MDTKLNTFKLSSLIQYLFKPSYEPLNNPKNTLKKFLGHNLGSKFFNDTKFKIFTILLWIERV